MLKLPWTLYYFLCTALSILHIKASRLEPSCQVENTKQVPNDKQQHITKTHWSCKHAQKISSIPSAWFLESFFLFFFLFLTFHRKRGLQILVSPLPFTVTQLSCSLCKALTSSWHIEFKNFQIEGWVSLHSTWLDVRRSRFPPLPNNLKQSWNNQYLIKPLLLSKNTRHIF